MEKLNSENGVYIKKLGELMEIEEKKLEEKKFEEKKSEITKKTQETENNDICDIGEKEIKTVSQFEHLSLIFTIFKNILYLADQNLIELMMSDDLYLITFGALECKLKILKNFR